MSKNENLDNNEKENIETPMVNNSLESIRDENGKIGFVEVPGEILLIWTGEPWKSRPKKLLMLVAIYVILFAIALFIMPDAGFFLLLVPLLLFGSASAHLVNSQYVITDEGIYWRNFLNQMFKPWLEIENFIFEDEMGELFFDKASIRARIQRNMPLYYGDSREEIEENVKKLHAQAWADRKIMEDRIRAEVIAELDKEREEVQ